MNSLTDVYAFVHQVLGYAPERSEPGTVTGGKIMLSPQELLRVLEAYGKQVRENKSPGTKLGW